MTEKINKGLYDAARFAIQPNMLGYCGEDGSQEILRRFVTAKSVDPIRVIETLRGHGFPHLNSFLESISSITKRDIFDDKVVASYWFGNNLTESTFDRGKELLVAEYSKNLFPNFGNQLQKNLPSKLYLTHLSQVALIAATDNEEPKRVNLINRCMIASGTVTEIDLKNKTAVVNRDILTLQKNNHYLVDIGPQNVKIDPDLTPHLNVGDNVAIHLGYLAAKLDDDEQKNLRFWTRKVAEII